jgi:hypothetical protein
LLARIFFSQFSAQSLSNLSVSYLSFLLSFCWENLFREIPTYQVST